MHQTLVLEKETGVRKKYVASQVVLLETKKRKKKIYGKVEVKLAVTPKPTNKFLQLRTRTILSS